MSSALLFFVAAGLIGCGGSSPKSPTSAGAPGVGATGLTIVFADGDQLSAQSALIRDRLEATFQAAGPQISLGGLTVTVTTDSNLIIPAWGMGGFTHNGSTVDIGISPSLSSATIDQRLPSLVAHEFHHAARFRGPGYGNTLLEAMVSEGLADHFASELFGEPLHPWAIALSDMNIDFWFERARPEFDSPSYSHSAWFFGTKDIPNWAGYSIGFRLVSDYQDSHSGTSAASLVNLDADAFRPD